MRFLDTHAGPVGGFFLGAGSAMTVEILKRADPTSPVVIGVAVVEVLIGLLLLARYARR